MCFTQAIFPDYLKLSKVICAHKRGSTADIGNYRPISLLSIFSKIFEKVLSKRILNFLDSNNVLSDSQHGFRSRKSTLSALCYVINQIYRELDQNKNVMALFIDLTKAFDCVEHTLLLQKCLSYGIRGNCHKLLNSYLSNRKQYVLFNKSESDQLTIEVGVPQGSVLGPLLFLIYINDMPKYLSAPHCEFADDITLLSSNKDEHILRRTLNDNLSLLSNYFSNNKLTLNQDKTYTMEFHPCGANYLKSHLIKLSGKTIKQVTSFKLLGLYLDLSLNWKEHVNFVCSQCSRSCFALQRLKQITSRATVKSFYYANIESRMRYGIVLWGASSASNRAFLNQKRAVRIMFNLKSRESCKPSFISEKIMTFPCLFIFELLKFVRQNASAFITLNTNHNYATRFGNNYQYELHRLELFKANPYYIGAVIYNKIPPKLRQLSNSRFLSFMRDLLLSRAFYTVEEFLGYSFEDV